MVNLQVEQFLVEPREVLDRQAVADFLRRQGVRLKRQGDCRRRRAAFARVRARCAQDEMAARGEPPPHRAVRLQPAADAREQAGGRLPGQDGHRGHADRSPPGHRRSDELERRRGWRWMFASGVFPAVVFLVLLLPVPESPRWLTKRGRRGEALAILTRVDGPRFAAMELRSDRRGACRRERPARRALAALDAAASCCSALRWPCSSK